MKRALLGPYDNVSIQLSCYSDPSTYFRRQEELTKFAGDGQRVEIAPVGDESAGYWKDPGLYVVLWRRGDVVGRGYFSGGITLEMTEDLVRTFDTMVLQR